MKILIAGCGQVGQTLAQELSAEGHDLTLMDSDPRVLETGMEHYDVMAVQGNCASLSTLREAGIEDADLLIATTGSDELNLLCCMSAHVANPHLHTIARIRNPEYTEQAYHMRDAFALSMVFNPELEAAVEIEHLLKFPGFQKRDSFAKGRVEIVEIRIDEASKLCNLPLSTLYTAVKCRVLVCAVLRGEDTVAPGGNFILKAGDRIFVTAPSNNLALLLKNLGIVTRKVKRAMVVGGGKIAYYLAGMLEGSKTDLTVIESDPARCAELSALLPETDIICGDARDPELLESEGLANADALISLTGSDELNTVLSLYGERHGLPQIITRIDRLVDSGIPARLPLGSIICPRRLCCNNIVRYVRAMQNQSGAAITVHAIADGRVEAMEFCVDIDTLHCGEPLKKIKLHKNILLACITSGSSIEIPNGDSCFRQGDTVLVVTGKETPVRCLNDIFA